MAQPGFRQAGHSARSGEGALTLAHLTTTPNTADPDAVFDLLVRLHDGLDLEASLRASARLVLLLANHIGDEAVIREAVRLAARPQT